MNRHISDAPWFKVLWFIVNTLAGVGFFALSTNADLSLPEILLGTYVIFMFGIGFRSFDETESMKLKHQAEEARHEYGYELFQECALEVMEIFQIFRVVRIGTRTEARISINTKLGSLRMGDAIATWTADKRELSRRLGYIVSDDELILELAKKLHDRKQQEQA